MFLFKLNKRVKKENLEKRKLLITQEVLQKLFMYEPNTGNLIRKVTTSSNAKKGDIAGTLTSDGYIGIQVKGLMCKAHRLIWLYVYGVWPKNEIDHVNRIRSDNKWLNLREATHQENMCNTPIYKSNKTGFTGVFKDPRRKGYFAKIRHKNKAYNLGTYATTFEASLAYQKAAIQLKKGFLPKTS